MRPSIFLRSHSDRSSSLKRPPSPLLFYCFHSFYCLGTRPTAEGRQRSESASPLEMTSEFSPSSSQCLEPNVLESGSQDGSPPPPLPPPPDLTQGHKSWEISEPIWPRGWRRRPELLSRPSKVSPWLQGIRRPPAGQPAPLQTGNPRVYR